MSERKVINKYYGPDFDPSKVPKKKRLSKEQRKAAAEAWNTVRVETPFTLQCLACNEFIPKGRKFNAKKKSVKPNSGSTTATSSSFSSSASAFVDNGDDGDGGGDSYLGLTVHYFRIKCSGCSAFIEYRTDAQSRSYVVLSGAKRGLDAFGESEKQQSRELAQALLERRQLGEKRKLDERDKDGSKDSIDKISDAERRREAAMQIHAENLELAEIQRQAKRLETLQSSIETKVDTDPNALTEEEQRRIDDIFSSKETVVERQVDVINGQQIIRLREETNATGQEPPRKFFRKSKPVADEPQSLQSLPSLPSLPQLPQLPSKRASTVKKSLVQYSSDEEEEDEDEDSN